MSNDILMYFTNYVCLLRSVLYIWKTRHMRMSCFEASRILVVENLGLYNPNKASRRNIGWVVHEI